MRGGDGEHAGGEVKDYGHVAEALGFGGGEGHVGDHLAAGFDPAAEIEEGAGPGAGGEDGEVGVEGGAVGELDAGYGALRGWGGGRGWGRRRREGAEEES